MSVPEELNPSIYSDYVNLHNYPKFHVALSGSNDEINRLKSDLRQKNVAVPIRKYEATAGGIYEWVPLNTKLYLTMVSEDSVAPQDLLETEKEQSVLFYDLRYNKFAARINGDWDTGNADDRWANIPAELGITGDEDAQRAVTALVVEYQMKEVFHGLHLLLQQVKIHHFQCTLLLQKMLATEDILMRLKGQLTTKVHGLLMHILCLLQRGKVLLTSCNARFWLLTALFKLENEEEFRQIISGLEEYCVLLIGLIVGVSPKANLDPISRLGSCAEKDMECFKSDIEKYNQGAQGAQVSGLVQFLRQRIKEKKPINCSFQPNDIKVQKRLGKGTFGVVNEISWNNITLAMKSFKFSSDEMFKIPGLRHPNIVTVVASALCPDSITRKSKVEKMPTSENVRPSMMMECMQKLDHLLVNGIGFSMYLDIILQIARAMRWLHEQDVMHRDLKPDNILVNSIDPLCKHIIVKISDFGTAKPDFRTGANSIQGTLHYMAPEIRRSAPTNNVYSRKADVYSFGKTCRCIQTGKEEGTWDSSFPVCLAKYLDTCIEEDENKRHSFEHICAVLELMKKVDLLGITSSVNQAYDGYSQENFSIDNWDFSIIEKNIIKNAALAMLQHSLRQGQSSEHELNGWLSVDRSVTPNLFAEIANGQFLDGTQFHLKSFNGQYIMVNDRNEVRTSDVDASKAEKFKLWRYTENEYHIRTSRSRFVSFCEPAPKDCSYRLPLNAQTLEIIIQPNTHPTITWVHIKAVRKYASARCYVEANQNGQVRCVERQGEPTWNVNDPAVFQIIILPSTAGEYQLVNALGPVKAQEALRAHWHTFYTRRNFKEFSRQQINVVHIPVGWWISNCPHPFVNGSLEYLDKAFTWANEYNIKIIIKLQTSPGYRDGEDGPHPPAETLPTIMPFGYGVRTRDETFDTMNYLCKRYENNPALLKMQLIRNHNYNGEWSFGP